jgi:hypothetical protein
MEDPAMVRKTTGFFFLSMLMLCLCVDLLVAPPAGAVRFLSEGYQTREAIMTEALLPPRQAPGPYVEYDNEHFDFTVLVPQAWTLYAHYDPDRVFGHVVRYIFVGPPDSASAVGFTTIEFRFVPTHRMGGTISSLDDYINTTLIQKNRIDGNMPIPPTDALFLGASAKEMMIEFPTTRPVTGTDDTPSMTITTRKKWTCTERNGYFVELSIHSGADDFDLYEPVYEQAKNSMSFR